MINPLVSVCLITYKHENCIRQAIESVLIQKVNFPFEFIIADDCSPDQTRAIIEEYKNQHPDLIRLLFQENNVGGGRNFVDLINSAQGKYIAYLEGDDYWTDPNKLQIQFDFLESNPNFSLSYHKIKWEFMYDSEELKSYPPESNIADPPVSTIYDILNLGWFIRSGSMFFKTIKLPDGFEKLRVGDYPLHILLADIGKVGFINACMGVYRIHNQGLSETTILVYDIPRRLINHQGDVYLLNYLNTQTKNRYKSYFDKKLFEEIYSFNHFLFQKSKRAFLKNIFRTFMQFNILFLVSHFFKKIFKIEIKPGDNNH
jgi:glycosyltransferase involved in cell wall biosynthesis